MSNDSNQNRKRIDEDTLTMLIGMYLAGLFPCLCDEIEQYEEILEPDIIEEPYCNDEEI